MQKNRIVKDGCQLSGRFRGLAQNKCNSITRKAHSSFLPIFFHNFSGYDSHLIFEKLVDMSTQKTIHIGKEDISAKTSELLKICKNRMCEIFGFLQLFGFKFK